MEKPLRIIQCGTGVAGRQAITAILQRPELELVGLLVHSESNDGRDAGSFIDAPDCGIRGTRDKEALIAARADVVSYMMLIPSLEDICRFLASGKNVITTAGFMFPRWNNKDAEHRLRDACRAGNSSFYVTGINPGFVDEVLPLTLSMLSRDWSRVHIKEYADCSKYPHKGIIEIMGFGFTPEEIAAGKVADMQTMVDFFQASVAALAHELGMELDEVRQSREFAITDKLLKLPCGEVAAGTVAGQRWRWAGMKDGAEKVVQETFWIVSFDLGEGWPKPGDMESDTRWEVLIEGTPSMRVVFEPRESFTEGVTTGVNPSAAATAMAVVNNLHAVAGAKSGLLTAADLRQPRYRG
jgi:2,4-diaminopentanoate dehydrogenase